MSKPGMVAGAAAAPRSGGWFLAALILGLALVTAPAWRGLGYFLARDNGRMHLPVKRFVADQLAQGRLPEWNPFAGLGTPVIATAVDGVLHPLTALLLIFPVEVALNWWTLVALVASAAGAWWWARTLGVSRHAATVAGFAFSLSGPITSATDNVTYLTAMATVPAFLAATQQWLSLGGAWRLGVLAGLSLLLAAAGDPQGWGLAMLAVPALCLFSGSMEHRQRRVTRGLQAIAATFMAAAPVVLPLLFWLPHSSRAGTVDALAQQRWNLAPVRMVEFAIPYLLRGEPGAKTSALHQALADPNTLAPWTLSVYLGVTALALGLLGAVTVRRARVLLGLAVVLTWMALGPAGGFGQIASALPLLRGFRYWEKMMPWVALMVAGAAAFGFDAAWRDRTAGKRLILCCISLGGLAVVALALTSTLGRGLSAPMVASLRENLGDGALHLGAFAGVLGLVANAAARGWRRMEHVLVAVVLLDLGVANLRAFEFQDRAVARPVSVLAESLRTPRQLERVLTPFEPMVVVPGYSPAESSNLLGAKTLCSAWNVGYGVGNFDAYTGASPERLAEVDRRLAPDRLIPNVGLWGVGHVVVPGRLELAAGLGLSQPLKVESSDAGTPAWLVSIPHRPRAYLAREATSATPAAALEFALDPGSMAGARTVVEGEVPPGLGNGIGLVSLDEDLGTTVRITTRTQEAELLVLNDAWAPGWTARIDGTPVTVLRANYLVRAVHVPPGEHQVVFEYRTPGLFAGWVATLGAILIVVALALRER